MQQNNGLIQLKEKFIAFILYCIANVLCKTYRYCRIGFENREKAIQMGNGGYVVAGWHQNGVHAVYHEHGTGLHFIVSQSKDGEYIHYILKKWGMNTVRGSSRRGGPQAKAKLIDILKSGKPGAITIDGPTGPKYSVKSGIIEASQVAQVPILPVMLHPEHFWEFNSWDKFRVAKPFSKIWVKVLDPIQIPKDCAREDYIKYKELIAKQMLDAEIALCQEKSFLFTPN